MQPSTSLSGRVALVTGASRGIGKAIATGLASAGADIVMCSRDSQETRAASDQIARQFNVRCLALSADITDRPAVDTMVARAQEAFGRIDILVNNAGGTAIEEIDRIEEDNWDRVLALNLTAAMLLTRALSPAMKARRWGRIINIASINAISSRRGRSSYSASKSGLLGLTRANAFDLGPFGITVNAIAPGMILTDLTRPLVSETDQADYARYTAIRRLGVPEDIVGPVLLLAGDQGSYISGSVLVVDGGMVTHVGPPVDD
jgi:NAD(P)-dependent dehydrogenase (short-subunit alcohol dehydrogenase family)